MRAIAKAISLRSFIAALTVVAGGVVAAGPADATFPGANGKIAFADFKTGQIYSINPDGTALTQLTHANGASFMPKWSPDGTKIAFSSDRSGEIRIWVMNADGSNQHLLAPDAPGYRDFRPHYTPDGKRIVFPRCKPNDGCCGEPRDEPGGQSGGESGRESGCQSGGRRQPGASRAAGRD